MKLSNLSLDLKSVVLGTLAGIAIMLSVGAATTATENKWEYKLVSTVDPMTVKSFNSVEKKEALLNDLGAQGWTFVQNEGGLMYFTRAKR
jgi:hypothetical protein